MDIALYISFGVSGIIFAIVFGYLYWDKISNFLKKHWFEILFSLCAAVLGFIIMNNGIGGKIGGAVLFLAVGWGIAWFLEIFIENINNKTIKFVVEISLCILLLIFAVTREYGTYNHNYSVETCSWCEIRDAEPGSQYCDSCYDKLF